MVEASDVGKKVRIVGRTDEWNGRTGEMLSPRDGMKRWPVRVDGHTSEHGWCWFMPDELVVEPSESESPATTEKQRP